jgi:hypothetical protein
LFLSLRKNPRQFGAHDIGIVHSVDVVARIFEHITSAITH